jgi:hypothetical protein
VEGEKTLNSGQAAAWSAPPASVDSAAPESADTREHIIWDVDRDAVAVAPQAARAPIPEVAPAEPTGTAKPEDNQTVEESAPLPAESDETKAARIQERLEKWLGEVKPILPHQEVVEYFSSSNENWVLATLQITFQGIELLDTSEAEMSPPSERIIYSAVVARGGQTRKDCKIDCIRPQFRKGEPVDVFSQQRGWAAGTIKDDPPPSATSLGYRVYMAEMDMLLEKVPPVRLRRRFTNGSAVLVYRGADKGWLPAVVHSDVDAGQMHPAPDPLGVGSPSGADGKIALEAWTMVPVYEEEEDAIVEPEPEWLPSYSLRCPSSVEGEADGWNL